MFELIKPKIGSKVRVLVIFDGVVYFGEGIVKGYYTEGCILFMVKEFARVNYNLAQIGESQGFANHWIELANSKDVFEKVRKFLNKESKNLGSFIEPFVFR